MLGSPTDCATIGYGGPDEVRRLASTRAGSKLAWVRVAQELKGPIHISLVIRPAVSRSGRSDRWLIDKLGNELKLPVIVENKVGAGGRVAAEIDQGGGTGRQTRFRLATSR